MPRKIFQPATAQQIADTFRKHGFDFKAAASPKWSDLWRDGNAESGFVRVAVEEGDEVMHVYRFTPNEVLHWKLDDIQYTAVPLAMIDAILAQAVASLRERA